jgi:hypothetical protein
LFHGGFGIRLGQQEIARYNWNSDVIKKIAYILSLIKNENYDHNNVQQLTNNFPPKFIHYTFEKEIYAGILSHL